MALERDLPLPVFRYDSSVPYETVTWQQEERVAQGSEALFLCEHPATITLGTGARSDDLSFEPLYYERMGVMVVKSPRGGKATIHAPGQLVGYPVLNLRQRGITIHGYLRFLEELMIQLCGHFGIHAQRIDGKAGCWIGEKKIGFIGVRVRKGFSFHGFSFNILPQRDIFRLIVPCGMPHLQLTSLEEELHGNAPDLWKVADIFQEEFFELLFGTNWNKRIV